jgi:ABC-2 type transport system ATP-binding protein
MTLRLDGITKSIGSTLVLDGVTAELPPGSIVALLGDNGAGKTTLLRCLATLWSPTTGDIYFDDQLLKRGRLDLRRRFMFLDDFPNPLAVTPLESAAVCLTLWDAVRPGIEQRVLDLFDEIGALSYAHTASGTSRGQRYKTALVCLMAVDSELWLLDEPFASGMDPTGLTCFKTQAAAAAQQRQRTIIYSTQLVEQACALSTHIAVLRKGKLQLLRTDADLGRSPVRLEELLKTSQP